MRLWRRVIDASTNAIIITDATQKNMPIVYVNPAFEHITGYSAAEVMGRNPAFLHGSDINQP
ncbi:MAG: diguanylate cyclase, partial [Zetaproteobacteria bacterium CG02_land_8_20_14_3_00_50_9]